MLQDFSHFWILSILMCNKCKYFNNILHNFLDQTSHLNISGSLGLIRAIHKFINPVHQVLPNQIRLPTIVTLQCSLELVFQFYTLFNSYSYVNIQQKCSVYWFTSAPQVQPRLIYCLYLFINSNVALTDMSPMFQPNPTQRCLYSLHGTSC